jgi:hypothetical protein
MKMTHRNYSEENGDFNRLARFFISVGGAPRAYSTWCMGRIVDWKYALYENKRAYAAFCEENAHLWFDAFGELAGFAISESGDAGFHVLTLDGYRFLYEEMLQWVFENWKERVEKGPVSRRKLPNTRAGRQGCWSDMAFDLPPPFLRGGST